MYFWTTKLKHLNPLDCIFLSEDIFCWFDVALLLVEVKDVLLFVEVKDVLLDGTGTELLLVFVTELFTELYILIGVNFSFFYFS